jgi:hypothetical protein
MKVNIYTVRDSAAGAYLQPFFMQNEVLAKRAISDLVNDPEHTFHKHVDSFSLFTMGDYDDQTGIFEVHEPRLVAPLNALLYPL